MNNHERARRYIKKQNLLGLDTFKFRLIDGDKVILENVSDGVGSIEIPDFVSGYDVKVGGYGPFSGSHYSEVIIGDGLKDISYLLSNIGSVELKVVIKGSGIRNISGLVSNSYKLRSIEIDDRQGNVVDGVR